MKNYYDELIENIEKDLSESNFESALSLIEEEFKMPYIPLDVEDKLKNLYQQIPLKKEKIRVDDIAVSQFLKMDEEHQLLAINYLESVNCRNYLREIKEYLISDNNRTLKSLLIQILIEQEINNELIMKDHDLEYHFIPSALEKPFETDGYQEAYRIINNTLGNDDIGSAKMAFEVLLKECYLKLPESYEKDEAYALAYGVIKAILLALSNNSLWEKYKEDYNIDEKYILDIHI